VCTAAVDAAAVHPTAPVRDTAAIDTAAVDATTIDAAAVTTGTRWIGGVPTHSAISDSGPTIDAAAIDATTIDATAIDPTTAIHPPSVDATARYTVLHVSAPASNCGDQRIRAKPMRKHQMRLRPG
jgi:hypothetical protein